VWGKITANPFSHTNRKKNYSSKSTLGERSGNKNV
jgi:hypothetical protein